MDPTTMTFPVIVAVLIGMILKRNPGVNNRLIPVILFASQTLQSLVGQFTSTTPLDLNAAATGAVPVVAAAILAHSGGKTLKHVFSWIAKLGPLLGAVSKVTAVLPKE